MTRYRTSLVIKVIAIVLSLLAVVSYILFNSRIFIAGPKIDIKSPENGALIEDSALIHVEGQAQNIAYLWFNSRSIYTDENGNFKESLLLHPGYNIIQISAKDKFNRKTTETLEVVYEKLK